MWRIENTQHPKSGLYKIPLDLIQFRASNTTAESIRKQAAKPNVVASSDSEPTLVHGLNDVFRQSEQEYQERRRLADIEPAEYNFGEDTPPCVKFLLENGLAELGTKNRADMALSGYFKASGVAIEVAAQQISAWARSIPNVITHVHDANARSMQSLAVLKASYGNPKYGFSCGSMLSCGFDKSICDTCGAKEVKPKVVALSDFASSENLHYPIIVEADAIGKDKNELIVPTKIAGYCHSSPDKAMCASCAMQSYTNIERGRNERTLVFDSKNPLTVELIDISADTLNHRIKRIFRLPSRCYDFRYEVEYGNAQVIYLASRITSDFKVEESITRARAIILSHGITLNRGYDFYGRVYSNPRTLAATFIVDKAEQLRSSLETFSLTPKELTDLSIFSPRQGQSVMDRINEIHNSFISNFIFIFGREDLLLAVDAVFHSARWIPFQKRMVKGWLDALVIGDTRQGKTATVKALMNYYNLGAWAAGETASRTGLLYNIQMVKGEEAWVSFGLLCRANGLLVAIDEVHDMPPDDFKEFTLVRDSGIVDVKRYAYGAARAETRLISIANPRSGMNMRKYGYPVMAILDVPAFKSLEDISKFDFAVGLQAGDISDDVINTDVRSLDEVDNPFTPELCRNLILWIWTRKPDDIIISHETEKRILLVAQQLASEYVPSVPLIESADIRMKILRVATALAGRTYNSTDGQKLIVEEEHVDSAVQLLERFYKSRALDYWGYSADSAKAVIEDDELAVIVFDFKTKWHNIWEETATWMLGTNFFTKTHMKSSLRLTSSDADDMVSFLLNVGMIEVGYRGNYHKTPEGRDFFYGMKHPGKQEREESVIDGKEDEL